MTDVTIPGVGRVTFPASMALADIQAASQRLSSQVGSDRKGGYNADLANIDQMMSGTAPGVPASALPEHLTTPLGGDIGLTGPAKDAYNTAGSFLEHQVTPAVVGATIGSLAAPVAAPVAGAGLALRALMAGGPQILGAGIGGGAGSALEENQRPGSTAETVSKKAILDGLRMAGSEAAGLGASAVFNKILTPNLSSVRELSEKAQEAASFVPGKVSQYIAGLPEGSNTRAIAEGAQSLVQRFAEPVSKVMDITDKFGTVGNVLATKSLMPLIGGPAAISLSVLRQLLKPGPLMQYLTHEPMSEASREMIRQLITAGIRTNAGTDQPAPETTRKATDDPFSQLATP